MEAVSGGGEAGPGHHGDVLVVRLRREAGVERPGQAARVAVHWVGNAVGRGYGGERSSVGEERPSAVDRFSVDLPRGEVVCGGSGGGLDHLHLYDR